MEGDKRGERVVRVTYQDEGKENERRREGERKAERGGEES